MALSRRKNMRLSGFDYTDAGQYFVTICLDTRELRFGQVHDGVMHQNVAGAQIEDVWTSLQKRFPVLCLDSHVVMPDHVHGIPLLHDGSVDHPELSLGGVIKAFKSESTLAYIRGVRQLGWTPFSRKLWQYNYYEHIIRNDRDLKTKRAYIDGNPARWQEKHSP